MRKSWLVMLAAVMLATALIAGCAEPQNRREAEKEKAKVGSKLSGKIQIDGSSTVYPITMAVAEEYMKVNPNVSVTVGISGTGGGFKRFTAGEIEISDASRPIKDEEAKKAKSNGVDYLEIPVAVDGISVVVNRSNDWAKDITVEELKKIWEQGSKIKSWKEIRPAWPDEKLVLYGPGTDSGTFDYFTEEIVGKARKSRSDFTASEDDNVLVQGVSGDKGALGYFGFSYYVENMDKLRALAVNGVTPTAETITKGTYKPLSRKIYIYVNKKALKRPEVKSFVEYYLTKGKDLVPETGYVKLPDADYKASLDLLK